MEEKINVSETAAPSVSTEKKHGGEYLVEVENLVKWFPIKSSFFRRTIGNVAWLIYLSFLSLKFRTFSSI